MTQDGTEAAKGCLFVELNDAAAIQEKIMLYR